MNAVERMLRGGVLRRLLHAPLRAAYFLAVGLFLWCVAQFYRGDTGFSSLISIGDMLSESKVTALRQTPHYVYESSSGYDGAYYVQLALHPTLDNPELAQGIDNLPYRAKRILFCWTAWCLGLGQPALIVQAHALLNVLCWLGLAWVLLHWFPPRSWENFLRWAAVLFSHGVIMSVRHSLVDGPSLLLVALAMRWLDIGRVRAGPVALALAGLGKETSLLATAGLNFDWRAPKTWVRTLGVVALIALPLFVWMGYVRWKFGPAEDPGLGNFTLPFSGYFEKLATAWADPTSPESYNRLRWTFGVVVALAVQWLFFALRRRPDERWWRVGAAFALMMVFLSTPVWEGFPGASTRVLLPMTLAFNVLVPRGWRWLPVLVAGNLTVAASVFEYSPPNEFYELRGDRAGRAALRVVPIPAGWNGPERFEKQVWRWAKGNADLKFVNVSTKSVRVSVQGSISSVEGKRILRAQVGEKLLWGETVGPDAAVVRFSLLLPPGETTVAFTSDPGGQKIATDPRDLSFQITNLQIFVQPAAASK